MPSFFRKNKSAVKTLNQKFNAAFFDSKKWEYNKDKTFVKWQYKFKSSKETENQLLQFLKAKDIPFQISLDTSKKQTVLSVTTNTRSMQAMLALSEGESPFNDKLNKTFYDKSNWCPINGNEFLAFSIKVHDVADQKILAHFLDVKKIPFSITMQSKRHYDVIKVQAKREAIAKLLTLDNSELPQANKSYHPYDIAVLDNIIEHALLDEGSHYINPHKKEVYILYSLSPSESLLKEKLQARLTDFLEEQSLNTINYSTNNALNIVLEESELLKFKDRPSLVRAA